MDVGIKAYPIGNLQMGMKRWIDVCGAIFGILLLSPLFLVVALLIQLETPGKVFYCQERIGRGGSRFFLIKFRTMRDCSKEEWEQIFQKNTKTRSEFNQYQKLLDDPRVTRIGRYLRKSSLDELPQLWNVLRGEMSLVGPRPFLPEQLHLYGPVYEDYRKMAPGITGLWQVSGRNHLSFAERISLDEKYIRRWSLRLDLQILMLTPWAVLSQAGAY
jgi:lipopolysaccharide/colanic/teichoic acid biosynthesis glycosyltransferase